LSRGPGGTPAAVPGSGAPSAAPGNGTPSAAPGSGTPAAVPGSGTPAADATDSADAAHAADIAGQAPASLPSATLVERAGALDWLLFDVDGVLTDGRLLYGADGEQWKVFDVRDGIGLKLAQRAGLKVGLLSGRQSRALEARAQELGLDALIMHRDDKAAAFGELLAARGTAAARVAYMGDDLVDLPVLLACGLSFAPADAAPDVRGRVHHVLSRPGGRGAVREMVELVLRARGAWDRLLAGYLRPAGVNLDP
jgi:3-deoxy-D-manno-octulosonate 8-phosphate phosphatase (KDO 8-P phosphatase)